MESLIKIKSIKRILVFGGIKNESEGLWRIEAFLLNCKRAYDRCPIWWNVNYVGLIDEAWKS